MRCFAFIRVDPRNPPLAFSRAEARIHPFRLPIPFSGNPPTQFSTQTPW
jgi:hypothetical protein